MEELEISIVTKKSLSNENIVFRFDSQYFKKKYLVEDKKRKRYLNKYLGEISFITDGQHGYHEVDENSPIRHLTAKNAKNWFADDIGADRIAKWVDDNNKRSSLQKGDLILSTRGSVGYCALVDEDVLPANIDQDVARIKLETDDIIPTVALTYLNCKIGQDWLERNQTGMVQQGIALWRVNEIPIPMFSVRFQESIDIIIRKAKSLREQSNYSYKYAENQILNDIKLNNFEQSKEQINIKNFKDSFLISNRLDAEYYQPKYEAFMKTVNSYKNGYKRMDEICIVKDSNYTPNEKDIYNYIELSDIGLTGGIEGCTRGYGAELPTRARRKVSTGDVIISSIEGSLKSCAIISEQYNNSLCSTGFYVINSQEINSETLLVWMKTDIMQNILKQNCSGTILTSINKSDFLSIPIPLFDTHLQENIQAMVTKSFDQQNKADRHLIIAKKAVEIAIEQDEETAIKYIQDNIN